jgi:ubiquinone/menaquinone biosynthesis C-methylase UbiE
MAVRAAVQLGVFTPLAEGPLTAEELGNALGLKPRRLEMLLYQLVASKFLELHDDRFANTPMAARYLVQGRQDYYGGVHELWTDQINALLKTADSIKADEPQAKKDFAGMTQDQLGAFLRGIHGMAVAAGRNLATNPQFSEANQVVDIGGGSGGVAIALCEEHPLLHATVIDFPSVIPIAEEMAVEAGLADRVTGLTTDVLEKPLPGGFDVATARAFFQVLSPEQCQQAAHNIAAALPSGGTLFIVGFVTDDSRLSPDVAVAANTYFLNIFDDGRAYTASQYQDWLSNAGFTDIVRTPFLAGNSLITARKA